MARIRIPLANWPLKLHTALAHLADGDTLVVPNDQVRAAAQIEIARRCQDRYIFLEVEKKNGGGCYQVAGRRRGNTAGVWSWRNSEGTLWHGTERRAAAGFAHRTAVLYCPKQTETHPLACRLRAGFCIF